MTIGVVVLAALAFAWLNPFRMSALHRATRAGDVRTVQVLLSHGADPDTTASVFGTDAYSQWTPLMWAAKESHPEIVRMLADAGADLERRDRYGRAPLFIASQWGCSECVQTLLDHGANPDVRTDAGEAPLHIAARRGDRHAVLHLLRAGADVNILDGSGATPLLALVTTSSPSLEVAHILVQSGADVDAARGNEMSVVGRVNQLADELDPELIALVRAASKRQR